MAERNRPTVHVQTVNAHAQFLLPGQADGGERLVHFEDVDVVSRQSGALEHLARGWNRPSQHHDRVRPDLGEIDEASPRPNAQILGLFARGDEHGRCTIRNLAGVASRQ